MDLESHSFFLFKEDEEKEEEKNQFQNMYKY